MLATPMLGSKSNNCLFVGRVNKTQFKRVEYRPARAPNPRLHLIAEKAGSR